MAGIEGHDVQIQYLSFDRGTVIGFTVSLLVAELSHGQGSAHDDHAKIGILAASVLAALLAATVLSTRNRYYRKLQLVEAVDADNDGIPDVYQQD